MGSNVTIGRTVGDSFYYASIEPCAGCFWFWFVVLFLLFLVIIFLYVFKKEKRWRFDEKPRDLIKLRRHFIDVWLQESLSHAIADYWMKDTPKSTNVPEQVETWMEMGEASESQALKNFNAELESRKRTFVRTLRKNAFKSKLSSEDSEWSVTLYDMAEGDQLDAETLLAQLVFVLPKPFIPEQPSKAYLKEQVRVALFTMLRKIHLEGVDCHVEALIASAVVVWNYEENVQVAGRPFYPQFPLLSLAKVKASVNAPVDEDAEMRRLKEPLPEVAYKMSYEEVKAHHAAIDQEVVERRRRLDKMKQNKWSRNVAYRLVNALTQPRVFEALDILNKNDGSAKPILNP